MNLQRLQDINEIVQFTLTDCESVIAHGLSTFLQVGAALIQIKNERLYLENYPSFEIYCRKRWGMTRTHAYRLLASATVVSNLSPIGDTPTHESQVRPLIHLSAEKQQEAWTEAVKGNPAPTASQVKAAVRRVAPECEPLPSPRATHGNLKESTFCEQPGLVERCRTLIELAAPEIEALASQFIDRPDVTKSLREAMGKLRKCWAALEKPMKQAT